MVHHLGRVAPDGWYELAVLALYVGVILIVGWLFYLVFERSALIWREWMIPAEGRTVRVCERNGSIGG